MRLICWDFGSWGVGILGFWGLGIGNWELGIGDLINYEL